MLSLKNAKMALSQCGLNEEQIQHFEKIITPYIDFHLYLMKKLNLSSEEAEELTKNKSKEYIVAVRTGKETEIELFAKAADFYKKFAIKNGYPKKKAEELKTNLVGFMSFIQTIQETKQE